MREDPDRSWPTPDADEPIPIWAELNGAAAMTVVAVSFATLIPAPATVWRFAVIAAAVGIFAALTRDWRVIPVMVVLAWLVHNAFLVAPSGLSWHGRSDVYRALALILAGWLGQVVGLVVWHIRAARSQADALPDRADLDW